MKDQMGKLHAGLGAALACVVPLDGRGPLTRPTHCGNHALRAVLDIEERESGNA